MTLSSLIIGVNVKESHCPFPIFASSWREFCAIRRGCLGCGRNEGSVAVDRASVTPHRPSLESYSYSIATPAAAANDLSSDRYCFIHPLFALFSASLPGYDETETVGEIRTFSTTNKAILFIFISETCGILRLLN